MLAEYQIPDERLPELRAGLEDAAAIWRWHGGETAGAIGNSANRKALSDVAKYATRLASSLEAMPPGAANVLNRGLELDVQDSLMGTNEAPSSVISVPEGVDTETRAIIDTSTLIALLQGFERAASQGEETLRDAPKGQRRDPALRMWMVNIADLWGELTGRPFTRDMTTDGQPISEAARFCADAFAAVSPKTPVSRVMNEMKACIRSSRKRWKN